MRVLMFGWEFPPFISGGLGTACYGLTRGLMQNNIDLSLVLPTTGGGKTIGDGMKIIGADQVRPLNYADSMLPGMEERMFQTIMSPYFTSGEESTSFIPGKKKRELQDTGDSILNFTGNYGRDLYGEVMRYGQIGETLGKSENFDIIHAHDWLTFPAGVRAKAVSGKKLVAHVHATEFDRSGEDMNPGVYELEKYGFEHADRIIAVSQYTKTILIERYAIVPQKIEVVHNGVQHGDDMDRPRYPKTVPEKIVLFLGRITMQKGPDYFLEAAHCIIDKVPDVRFVMAGSGDMLYRMIEGMASRRIAERFHFTGFLRGRSLDCMYGMSDLFVMPSVSEPFGLTPFEALQHEVPVIISKQSGAAEILKSALAIDFWDVDKLASAILTMLTEPLLVREILEKCREVMHPLSWKNTGAKVRAVYEQTLSKD